MYLTDIATEKTLANSQAFEFMMKEFAKLVALGHVDAEIPFTNLSQVTYGRDVAGRVIAGSVHFYDPNKRAFWIQFSAVDEAHRGKGAYKDLSMELERLARRAGAQNIYSGVSTLNERMMAIASKTRKSMLVRFKIPLSD